MTKEAKAAKRKLHKKAIKLQNRTEKKMSISEAILAVQRLESLA